VDRQQMIDQALNGFGILGNDLYSPFDPAYAKDLPQRMQDVDQAKSLLKQAGQENLAVELVTSTAVGAGAVESANLVRRAGPKAGVAVQADQGRRQRLLRRPLPVLELRPGLLEHPQLRSRRWPHRR
jgi:peptide/nickel transport system substrate-binding protein